MESILPSWNAAKKIWDFKKAKKFTDGMKLGVSIWTTSKILIFLTTLHVNIENVTQRCGHIESDFQLGPLNMRDGSKQPTEQLTSLAVREWQQVRYIPNEERHRSDAVDQDLEKWLIWLSENWHTYFANDGSSSSSSSSTSWNYSWSTGNAKWYWDDVRRQTNGRKTRMYKEEWRLELDTREDCHSNGKPMRWLQVKRCVQSLLSWVPCFVMFFTNSFAPRKRQLPSARREV